MDLHGGVICGKWSYSCLDRAKSRLYTGRWRCHIGAAQAKPAVMLQQSFGRRDDEASECKFKLLQGKKAIIAEIATRDKMNSDMHPRQFRPSCLPLTAQPRV